MYFQHLKETALRLLVFNFLFLGTIPKASGQYVYNDNQFIGYNGDTGIVSISFYHSLDLSKSIKPYRQLPELPEF